MKPRLNGGEPADIGPLGVIDVGSNSVRLVIYEGAIRAPAPLFNEKVLCGLGRAQATTGKLGKESVDRALAALRRFRAIAHIRGVTKLSIIATAAVREASNGEQFIERAEHECGVRIRILSGEEEARFAGRGVLFGFGAADGIAGDLGGGSLELTDLTGTRLRGATSLPLGGLKLIGVTGDNLDRAVAVIEEGLAEVPWLAPAPDRSFYAIGGTWRALARLHMEETRYPLQVIHGYAIPTCAAIEFCDAVRKEATIAGYERISRARREVLPVGAMVMRRLLYRLQPDQVVFSGCGIREGLLWDLLSDRERLKDPLLSLCERHAQLNSRSAVHARELCNWTDPIFRPPGPSETVEERRLRHAACLISDADWHTQPDYRGKNSFGLITDAALAGIDHPGRLFLAFSVYFRHLGPNQAAVDALSPVSRQLVQPCALRRALLIAAAIRTAHMLSMGRPGIINTTSLSYEPGKLVLDIPAPYGNLDGEGLRRRFRELAGLLKRQPHINFGRKSPK